MPVAVSFGTEVEHAEAMKMRVVFVIPPAGRGGFLLRRLLGAMAQGFGPLAPLAVLAFVHLLVIVPAFGPHFR